MGHGRADAAASSAEAAQRHGHRRAGPRHPRLLSCWTAVGGIVFGILAIIFGIVGAGRARRGRATNRGVAISGIITGVLGLIVGIVFAVIFAVAGFFFTSGGGQSIVECARQQAAHGASPEQAGQACQQQFQNQVQRQVGQ